MIDNTKPVDPLAEWPPPPPTVARVDWNTPPAGPVEGARMLWLLERYGWSRAAALEALAVAWANVGTDGFDAIRIANGNGVGPFALTAAQYSAAGATTGRPYGPRSVETPAGVVGIVTAATRKGADLSTWATWKQSKRYAEGRTRAASSATRLDEWARRAQYANWTPFDLDAGEAIPVKIPVVDDWLSKLDVGGLVRLVGKLLSYLLNPEWWKRLGIGLAGVLLVIGAVVLAAKS